MKAVSPLISVGDQTIWTLSVEDDDWYYEIQRSALEWSIYLVDATDERDFLLSKRGDPRDVHKIMKKCGVVALFNPEVEEAPCES